MAHATARWSLPAVHLIYSSRRHQLSTDIGSTGRSESSALTVVGPNRKVPDLYFKVVDPKLQVADLKGNVGKLGSCGIPLNLTPGKLSFEIECLQY